jgi:hypothetical protein
VFGVTADKLVVDSCRDSLCFPNPVTVMESLLYLIVKVTGDELFGIYFTLINLTNYCYQNRRFRRCSSTAGVSYKKRWFYLTLFWLDWQSTGGRRG